MQKYLSIFNPARGPVAMGPSSSNTAALYRIGKLVYCLAAGIPKKIDIALASSTSYARTYLGMRSDFAFITGLLNKSVTDCNFTDAYQNAEDAGLKLSIDTESWQGTGTMKGSKIDVTTTNNENFAVIADSTGGGAVALLEILAAKQE
jgi:iron-sulfur-dependent L-serine dehydratase beta subunit